MSVTLLHSPSRIIAALLIAGGQGADPAISPVGAWPVYANTEPDTPDNCITITNTEGSSDGRDMDSGELDQHWGLQFRFRGTTNPITLAKVMAVRNWIAKSVFQTKVTVEGTVYTVWSLNKISSPIDLNKDKPNTMRSIYTINCTSPIRL